MNVSSMPQNPVIFAIIAIALLAVLAFLIYISSKQRLRRNNLHLESLKELSEEAFIQLLENTYQQNGFATEKSMIGGADIILRKGETTTLLKCNNWRLPQVDVHQVSEIFETMTDLYADQAIIISSGRFTVEALRFARGKNIQLLCGPALLKLLKK